VNGRDFPADARGRAGPYGIYDLTRHHGPRDVGQSADTPRFAVAALMRWWTSAGQQVYPTAQEVLVLAAGVEHRRSHEFGPISLNCNSGQPSEPGRRVGYMRGTTTTTLRVSGTSVCGRLPHR
jgi:hypothetical protein